MALENLITINLTLLLLPVYLALIVVEAIVVQKFGATGTVDLKDSGICVFMGLSSAVMNGIVAFISLGVLFWAAQFKLFTIPTTLWTLLACFVLDDLRYYCHHRIAHRCRWVWTMHIVHHSSERYSLAVAMRQAWTKHFKGTVLLKVPLVLVGFDPILVIFCGLLIGTYQFWIHTEMIDKMPRWYETIFNTPSHHRVHHGSNAKYIDKNYGGTFIIWDKLFGSFEAEDKNDPPVYGLTKNIHTFNPLKIAFREYAILFGDVFQRGIRFPDRLRFLLAPPGWQPVVRK